jgi:AraC-like DNA-binding protein
MFAAQSTADAHPALDRQALGRRIGRTLQLTSSSAAPDAALLRGRFSMDLLREGLHLHCTDIVHLHDMTTRFTTEQESVKVLLRLEGTARVKMGGRPLDLHAGRGTAAVPKAVLLDVPPGQDFERSGDAGVRERMVAITLSPDWLEATGLDRSMLHQQAPVLRWRPSARALAIAEQLVRPEVFDGAMLKLLQESRTLELVAEALGAARHACVARPATLRPADYRRICSLRDWLDSGDADALTLVDIARAVGSNPHTLQQLFRVTFGRTVIDYLRENRLRRAATALQRDGVSVARAAEIAGYSSQANFSTAFRRHFGHSPRRHRDRL